MKVLLVTVTLMVAASMAERQDKYESGVKFTPPMARVINEEVKDLEKQAEDVVDRVFQEEMPSKVVEAQRLDSVLMAENALEDKLHGRDGACFLRSACSVATVAEADIPEYSMAHGLVNFRTMLQKMVEQVEDYGADGDEYPNIRRVLASFEVGSSSTRLSMCQELFSCPVASVEEVLSHMMTPKDPSNTGAIAMTRTSCEATAVICPGLSTGCALCGLFLPGVCGSQCIISGLYCGLSGFSCLAAAAADEEEPEEVPGGIRDRHWGHFYRDDQHHHDHQRQYGKHKPYRRYEKQQRGHTDDQYTTQDYFKTVFGRFHDD